jgi:hypothetical protein
MSGGDRMNPSTQVPIVRCMWVHVTMSYRARHLMPLPPEAPAPIALLCVERPSSMTAGARVRTEPGHGGSTIDRQVVKSYLSTVIMTGGLVRTIHGSSSF